MKKLDRYEREILSAFEKGKLKSARPPEERHRTFRDAARATLIKDKRVNIRLSVADLMGIRARAVEEGMPYQTLMASVLPKYVSGRLRESKSHLTPTAIRTPALRSNKRF